MIAGAIGLYLLSTGVSWAAFSKLGVATGPVISPVDVSEERSKIDLSGPKTEECPLNGAKYTKTEREIWETRRPLGIMIENHEESRPQSGLSRADVIYETVAEGGITRFLAIFYCGASASDVQIGPVRSARTYYLDWISEYGKSPLYAHVGGANTPGRADALGQIVEYGWLAAGNDLNQFSIPFPTFWRDLERLGRTVAKEHTMYSSTDKLWEFAAEKRGLAGKDEEGDSWDKSFVPWKFAEGQSLSSPKTPRMTVPFWNSNNYWVTWDYDSGSNLYKRSNGGQPHKDLNNDEQLQAANVVVMFTRERGPIDDLKHVLYDTIGRGNALVFQNGDAIDATWSKKTRTERTKFTDKTGAEIQFVRGPIWIQIVDVGADVTY